ncbi:hypothetical protein AHiyo6_01240 [Arthrobacter sp. Hiyo6]|nr:hypothetical protein AHiyo6_01240 [Arthrobacter sp. Hiyo6]
MGIKAASGNLVGLSTNDNTGDAGGGSSLATGLVLYNGTAVNTWDRARANSTVSVIAAGTTTTQTNIALTTYNAKKLVLVVNVSAVTGGNIVVTINGKSTSGYSYQILTSASLTAIAVTPLRVGVGLTAAANTVANDVLPRDVTVTVTVTGTITYGVDAILAL